MKLRTGDSVLVIRGRDRGKQGAIQQVLEKESQIVVDGVNMVTKHARATAGLRQAGIIQKEMPIQVSNVKLVCIHCNEPTRIAHRVLADGTKARICKKCDEIIE